MGGKCSRCGYAVNLAALQFHHVSRVGKAFQLDLRHLSNRNWQVILEESRKCILLCANCHAEIHSPEYDVERLRKTILGAPVE